MYTYEHIYIKRSTYIRLRIYTVYSVRIHKILAIYIYIYDVYNIYTSIYVCIIYTFKSSSEQRSDGLPEQQQVEPRSQPIETTLRTTACNALALRKRAAASRRHCKWKRIAGNSKQEIVLRSASRGIDPPLPARTTLIGSASATDPAPRPASRRLI